MVHIHLTSFSCNRCRSIDNSYFIIPSCFADWGLDCNCYYYCPYHTGCIDTADYGCHNTIHHFADNTVDHLERSIVGHVDYTDHRGYTADGHRANCIANANYRHSLGYRDHIDAILGNSRLSWLHSCSIAGLGRGSHVAYGNRYKCIAFVHWCSTSSNVRDYRSITCMIWGTALTSYCQLNLA